MGYVTVTGATGLTLGINQDSSQIIQGLQQVGEQTALQVLSSITAADGAAIDTDAVSVAGGVTSTAESDRIAGVAMVDRSIRAAAGADGVQEITGGGDFTARNTVSAIDIGSATSTLLNQGIALDGGTTPSMSWMAIWARWSSMPVRAM